jgi:aspartate/methionine/tyrosine aminotransferase
MRLSPFKLERYFAQHEFSVPYLLSSSDCESFAVQDLLALDPDAHDRFQQLWLGYTESQGSPSLRQAICALYTTVQPDHVLVHSGAEEAIFLFMHAALRSGDHVIVHTPCYQSLAEVARSIGCSMTLWRGYEARGWAPDVDELRRAIRPTTKAIIINTPHNPTGYLMPVDEFHSVLQLADRHGIIVFSDEVYRESEHDAVDRLPAACDLSDRAVSLGVVSKTYGLPGLRIGWIATHNARILAQMAHLKDYTTICNSAPSEFLAELALRHRGTLVQRNVAIITRNVTLLDGFFAHHAERCTWHRPKAGPIAFPRLLGEDVEIFCHNLVMTAGVLLVPGTVFDDQENHFRIGFGRRNMPQAIGLLEQFLDENPG